MRPISKSRLFRPMNPNDPIIDRDPGDEQVEPGPLLELPEPVWDYGIETSTQRYERVIREYTVFLDQIWPPGRPERHNLSF